MKLEVHQKSTNGFSEVIVKHKREEVVFETRSLYSRLHTTPTPFFEINEYLETLPVHIQDQMFELYCSLSDELMEGSTEKSKVEKISKLSAQLLDMVEPNDLKRWLIGRSDYVIPDRVREDTSTNSNNPKETTYDERDYTELAVFSVAMRLMLPVWGLYFEVASQTGTNYVDTMVVQIMYKSKWVEYPAHERLLVYCRALAEKMMKAEIAMDHVLGGLASYEVPFWLRNKAILRRVIVTDVLGIDSSAMSRNLVTNLYYLARGNNLAAGNQRGNAGKILPKTFSDRSNGRGEEDKTAIRENYKMKKRLVEGDYVLLNESCYDLDELIDKIDPSVPQDIRDMCEANIDASMQVPVYEHQIRLIQACVWRAVPPKGVPYLDLIPDPEDGNPRHPGVPAIRIVSAVAQALLCHWGFYDIAIYLSVHEDEHAKDADGALYNPRLHLVKGRGSRSTTDEKSELDEVFPYVRKAHKRRTRQNKWEVSNIVNSAKAEIEFLLSELASRAWVYKGNREIIKRSTQKRGQRNISMSGDMRHDLVKLYVKAASKTHLA